MSRTLPNVFTDEERLALLAVPYRGRRRPRSLTALRNSVLMRLMANGGFRASEVLALDVDDVAWSGAEAGRIHIRNGKGGKDRIIAIGEKDLDLLIEMKEKWDVRSGPLFRANDDRTRRLSYRSLHKQVERYAYDAGILPGKRVSPHTFRHTFATRLYRQTRDLLLVSKALGHASTKTTEIYTHLVDDDTHAAMRALGDHE